MKVVLDYPAAESERRILTQHSQSMESHDLEGMGLARLKEGSWMMPFQKRIQEVLVEEGIVNYVQILLDKTRTSPHLHLGVSPRGGIALLRTGRCLAALDGRGFITPDDIKTLARPVLRHRVILRPEAELEGLTPDRILSGILEEIPVPR
jgi:MoxR-like ATPase